MIDEYIMDIFIATYTTIVTIFFGITWRKRRDLLFWFIGLGIFSIGAFFLIFKIKNEIFRLIGDIFYLTGFIFICIFSLFEYYSVFLKPLENKVERKQKMRRLTILLSSIFGPVITSGLILYFLSIIDLVVSILFVMSVGLIFVIISMLKVYLAKGTVTRLFFFYVFIAAFLTTINSIIGDFGFNWSWTLSYAMNFIFITFILTAGLASPIEARITKSENNLRKFNEELEQQVENRTKQLAEVNIELESFSYSVSHDLRSPLRIISGFSNVLLKDHQNQLDVKGKDLLLRINSNTEKMGQIIDDLLELSRLSQKELNKKFVNLSNLMHEAIDDQLRMNPYPNVKFVIQESLFALCDPILIRLVLENFICNALKFTNKNPFPEIEFGSRTENDKLIFFVRDNGVGFDMKYKTKLFEVFQRLHNADEFSGSGIGLATVKRIIKKHGGEVWAEGEEGKGATFYFTLEP